MSAFSAEYGARAVSCKQGITGSIPVDAISEVAHVSFLRRTAELCVACAQRRTERPCVVPLGGGITYVCSRLQRPAPAL